ncbi:DMT family transporter [Bacillus shivajii]|nr:DMT family transporter [Bacillus shivajii]
MIYSYILLIFVVIFYAGNILIGKAINELPPFTIAFFRVLVAFIVILPIGILSAWRHRATFLQYKKPVLIMTLTGVTFFNTFIYGSLQFTTATNVAVLETVIPVVTVVLSAWLLRERLRKVQWLGIILSFIGAVWVVMDGRIFQLANIDWNIGDAIMIGAIGTWAIYSIYVKKWIHLLPPYAALFVMTGVSVIVLLPFVMFEWFIAGVPTLANPSYITGLLYLGVFPSLVALIFYNRAVQQLGASRASVFLNFLPVFTMVGAYFWLGEVITSMQIIGAIAVMGGVVLTTQAKQSEGEGKVAREHAQ